ncbi:MAG: C4-dicarboxylate ABC transporter permease [Alphaproteobacteria bacterium HGW-Alphaproteobacteria-6]|nr:MAG: C4-dicarboxylate ABC transporter permease [Alphaproteobacteria bacterium HGW-Alphaproteobacteria-6]
MHRFFLGLSRLMAVLGGIVLTALVVMVCASILGRSLNGLLHGAFLQSVAGGPANWLLSIGIGPVAGDFELVETGMAFAIFAFLPLCQITSGHAAVDIFTNMMPPRVQRILKMLVEIAFAAALIIIAVQLKSGMDSKIRSGQTTFLLQFPVWWAYATSLVAAVVAAVVGCYMAAVRIAEAATGRILLAEDAGAGH